MPGRKTDTAKGTLHPRRPAGGPVPVPSPAPCTRSLTHTHTLRTHSHPTDTADPAGLTPESPEEGKTRGVWPPGAQPWPVAPRGGVPPGEERGSRDACPSPQAPGFPRVEGRGAGGRQGRAPGRRPPAHPAPPRGRKAGALETNLSNIKKEPRDLFSQLGRQWPNRLQYNECICFLHKF